MFSRIAVHFEFDIPERCIFCIDVQSFQNNLHGPALLMYCFAYVLGERGGGLLCSWAKALSIHTLLYSVIHSQ